ncbi:MAG TPA: DinB family protein [Pyrinomonadaceae bacterium]|nr:DinB family protein [Pyrinomonadaceae bacterium]
MVHRTAWVARKFNFDFPAGVFPNIVERLRGTPARLESRLLSLPAEILTRRDGERWSMQEHAGHLLDLEALGIGRLDDFEQGLETLRAADMQNRKTYEANYNADSIENILNELRAERARFVRRLDAYDDEFIGRTALHPRLNQPMRVVDHALFIAEHDDHHMASITELIQLFGAK